MSRVFLTHILPPAQCATYHLSIAASNFSYALIEGGLFDSVYSTMPPFVTAHRNELKEESFTLVYSRLHSWGRRWGSLASIHDQILMFRRIPRGTKLWLYNVSQLNFVLVLLLWMFKRGTMINVIELDHTPSTRLSIHRLFQNIINRSHGVICLSDSPLLTNMNRCCLPGVVSPTVGNASRIKRAGKSFLLSGTLNEHIAMQSQILILFSQMPELTLHITGKSENEGQLREYADRYENIIYHGQVDRTEYRTILQSVTFVLSTRDPEHPDNALNFPSKIIEALSCNRGVISTIHYPQLAPLKYLEVDVRHLAEDFHRIASMSAEDLVPYVNQSELTRRAFSTKVWDEKMKQIENYES